MGMDVNVYLMDCDNGNSIKEICNFLPYDIRFLWNAHTTELKSCLDFEDNSDNIFEFTEEIFNTFEDYKENANDPYVASGIFPFELFKRIYSYYLKKSNIEPSPDNDLIDLDIYKNVKNGFILVLSDDWVESSHIDTEIKLIEEQYIKEIVLNRNRVENNIIDV